MHAGPWVHECFQLSSACMYVIISAHNDYISFFMTPSSNQEERRKEQKREKMIEIRKASWNQRELYENRQVSAWREWT